VSLSATCPPGPRKPSQQAAFCAPSMVTCWNQHLQQHKCSRRQMTILCCSLATSDVDFSTAPSRFSLRVCRTGCAQHLDMQRTHSPSQLYEHNDDEILMILTNESDTRHGTGSKNDPVPCLSDTAYSEERQSLTLCPPPVPASWPLN
jgi:hypothetical protein